MKVVQFRATLEAAEELYRNNGNLAAAQSLKEVSTLFAGHEMKTVSALSNMIAKIGGPEDVSE